MFLLEKLRKINNVRRVRDSQRPSSRRIFQFEQLEAREVMDASGGFEPTPPGEIPEDDTTEVLSATAVLDEAGTLHVYGTPGHDEIRILAVYPDPAVGVQIYDSNNQLILNDLFYLSDAPITSIEVSSCSFALSRGMSGASATY